MDILDFKLSVIPIQKVEETFLSKAGISLSVLRTDLLHPQLSGNKWYKLKYNLLSASEKGIDTLLSFGGVWSNHIHALSAAGRLFGFKTIGVIRGELADPLNSCLKDARENGMRLYPVSRELYRQKNTPAFINSLHDQFGDFHLIPEGGANTLGIKGAAEILDDIDVSPYHTIAVACGTGTTLAGMLSSVPPQVGILGFQILKANGYLKREVEHMIQANKLNTPDNWHINDQYHFGGYARITRELHSFCKDFMKSSSIPVEPVNSGKMLFGLYDLVKRDFFPQNSSILAIHGGGLQGLRGFNY